MRDRLVATCLLLCLAASTRATASPPPDAAARVDALFAEWSSTSTPGCAVAVEQGGGVLVRRAYGMADLEHGLANTPETIFEAGSVSKQFTATVIHLLAMDGALSVDDDVREHVPEVPDYGETITVRHLMNHTSGLRDWGNVAGIAGWGRSQRTHTHDHVLDIVSRQSALNFPPGAEYSYCNTGYNLQAVIASRVGGIAFAELSKRRIFDPLGMRHTQWRDDYRRIVPGRSAAYRETEEGGWEIDRPIEDVHGNGGLLTTVDDLLTWNRALRDGRLGGEELTRRVHERGKLADGREIEYASGVRISDLDGVPSITHTGATSGYRAFLGRYPDQDLSVALLCNAGNVNPGRVGSDVARIFLGAALAEDEETPAMELAPDLLEARAGLYRDVLTGEALEVGVEDGLPTVDGRTARPVSELELLLAEGRRLLFPSGAPERSTIRMTGIGLDRTLVPVAEADREPGDVAELVGSYASADAEATLVVALDEGALVVRRRPAWSASLEPVYRDAYLVPGLGLLRFHRDADGRVTELGVFQGRVYDLRFQRSGD